MRQDTFIQQQINFQKFSLKRRKFEFANARVRETSYSSKVRKIFLINKKKEKTAKKTGTCMDGHVENITILDKLLTKIVQ